MDPTDVDFQYDYYQDDVPSPCDTVSFHNWYDTLQLCIYSLVCAVGLVGNITVILSYACFCRKTRMRMTMTDVYLINMAVAHLVFVMALPVTIFYERNGWPVMGVAVCKLARGAYSIKLHCSALLLACLSGDRYTAIVQARGSSTVAQAGETSMLQDGDGDMEQGKDSSMVQPMGRSSLLQDGDSSMAQVRERSWMYRLLVSLIIWALAVILSVPTFIYTTLHQSSVDQIFFLDQDLNQSYVHHDFNQSYVDYDLDLGFAEHADLTMPAECVFNFNVVQISLGFFLPLLVAGFCCVCITVTLLRTKALWQHEAACVVLTMVFAMCHLPYNAAQIYHLTNWKTERSCNAEMTLDTVVLVTRVVAYVHSCLYPVLYALTVGVFRHRVQRRAYTNWRTASRQASDPYIPTNYA
ncbi:C-X-C chemokine receptor type 2-like [Engraulis encrasicolus]|uniref:C-X-C chemokine receptor type 2-like n=1 Tax=Engraulis encrasicolus TaxID=184585 RepID=UPI002FCEB8D3